MKIRKGFVSNSSSSSFCILGVVLPEDYDAEKFYDMNFQDKTVNYVYGIYEYHDYVLVGADPSKMKDEETLAQFKERVVKDLNELGFETTVDQLKWHTDGGYDG